MAADNVRNPSLCVARLLDDIVGTDETVRVSRRFILLLENCMNINKSLSYINTGSLAEGYKLRSSDVDFMTVDHNVTVLEVEQNDTNDPKEKTFLLMRRDGCYPGYVVLQILSNFGYFKRDFCAEWNKCIVLSSTLLQHYECSTTGTERNGPCTADIIYEVNRDIATSLVCKQWPIEAGDFFRRPRIYGWPSRQLLNDIRRNGCHVVPIGDKLSDLVDIQWRISFAVAERMLVHSFNHTQLRVYVLMKIFQKQVIETYDGVEDLLCSYFMKTLMFHMIESTDPLIWREDNFITLFWRCFNNLVKRVKDGYLTNFFISDYNLFRGKIYGKSQNNLIQVLRKIRREGWRSLYRCQDLKNRLSESFNLKLLYLGTDMKHIEALKDFKVFELLTQNIVPFDHIAESLSDYCRVLHKVINISNILKKKSDRDILVILSRYLFVLIGKIIFHNIQNQDEGQTPTRNKDTYMSIRMCERLLLEGAKLDISRGPLTLALFYYAKNKFEKVIQICNKVISSVPLLTRDWNNLQRYKESMCGRGMELSEKLNKTGALHLVYSLFWQYLYPKDIQHYDVAIRYPPLPFAIFLTFLCYHERGDIDNSLSALHDLQTILQDEKQGISRYPVILNLLAICLDKVGDMAYAAEVRIRLKQLFQPKDNSWN